MLINLHIKDFLLIDELAIDFFAGLTVITGETGSGKSITLDALMLIFGAKASPEIIRQGQAQASFSATFQVDNRQILAWLQEKSFLDPSEVNSLIIRRVIERNGRSKAYINSQAVTMGTLKELGEMLVDIHTQHASIALLKAENQRALLDEFAKITPQVVELAEQYRQVNLLETKLKAAREFSQDIFLKQEILKEKISELMQLNLKPSEWDELQIEQKRLANASFILQELDYACNLLNNEASPLRDTLATVSTRLAKIGEFLPNYQQLTQLAGSLEAEIAELDHELQMAAQQVEPDPQQLALVDARIDEIYSLARKYRIQPSEILNYVELWQAELAALAASSDVEQLAQELAHAQAEYQQLAQLISVKRQEAALTLSQQVTALLQQLAITGHFKVVLLPISSAASYGLENIQYQVCFNQGMPLQPLHKVASGGELSRVALALYVTLSVNNPPELIVFDEVDVGIGGGIAEVVGTLLQQLGTAKQVICITHQPQTACCGDWHLKVQKQELAGATYSQITYCAGDQRIKEIARMLGGLNLTATTVQHATEMLATSYADRH